MRSSVETGLGLAPCLVPSSSDPTLTYRLSARPEIIFIIACHNHMLLLHPHPHPHHHQYNGKIVRIITTTIIIIITDGNLIITVSSNTNRQEKDKNCHRQYKIVEIVESGVAKVDHI
ncbi:hypothetical protein ElyMa_002489600 [Elysia marginata]|uniref:Uncharacterized protein n=1 Tax=Elysia marginata TaxID=1093978 RepID=A0AAV4GR09_9GAST|nr:hypothetical protein ElyMa_002489600 [Elysia marginata]